MRFFFDLLDGGDLLRDEEGKDLSSLQLVQQQAALILADIAKDVLRKHSGPDATLSHLLSIQVRDVTGPVLQVGFTFALSVNAS